RSGGDKGAETAPPAETKAAETGGKTEGEGKITKADSLLSPGIAYLAAHQTMLKCGIAGGAVSFSLADFASVLGYTPTSVTIESLPARTEGSLRVGALELAEGQTLSAATVGQLRMLPMTTEPATAVFSFTAKGKAYETDIPLTCSVFLLEEKNEAPTSDDVALSTFCDISVQSMIRAVDPEHDALTYTVIRGPKKGIVEMDAETGAFTYTPAPGKRGTDVFTCQVRDCYGNESEICKITMSVRRPETEIRYADMDGHWAACSALRMAEEGILVGEQVGNRTFFSPDRMVTRGEFLVMAMKTSGIMPGNGDDCSTFADADCIPGYMKPYVACALNLGIVHGAEDEEGCRFDPDAVITRAEAAVMLNRMLGIDTPDALPVFADADALPVWSRGAVYALQSAGIMSGCTDETGVCTLSPTARLDRAQTAQLLTMALDYQNTHKGK
ncbi:MAG: S-layer homology domain-containing protein, partial [Clostridia bacterium]|nr:S-layer homology domain-containing protein [Clostridia bacterium]